MPYCSSCGLSIPDGQGSSCSMCYGDPYHGSDGYYLAYLEQEMLEEERLQQEILEQVEYEESQKNEKGG